MYHPQKKGKIQEHTLLHRVYIYINICSKDHKNPGVSYRSPGLHLVSNPIVVGWDLNPKRPIRSRGVRILRGRYLHALVHSRYIVCT